MPVMPSLNLKPTHKAVIAYYDSLAKFASLGVKHETAVRSAFQELLDYCARQFDCKLVPEYALKRKGRADAKADGAVLNNINLIRGLWEAKDSADDLDEEIKRKFAAGYPKENILFWQPDRAVLYQNGERFYEADLTKPEDLFRPWPCFWNSCRPLLWNGIRPRRSSKTRFRRLGEPESAHRAGTSGQPQIHHRV